MSSRPPLRAAVFGAGLMGRWHADAVTRGGGVVSIVYDPDAGRARTLAARYPGATAAATVDDLFRPGAADVAHVCTPTGTHRELVERSLGSGMHVLVEKPLVATAGETETLLQLAASRERLLSPVHQMVFQPGVIDAKRALAGLGAVIHIDSTACSAGADGDTDDQRTQTAFDILPHPLSILTNLFPRLPDQVQWRVDHPAAGELRVTGGGGGVSVSLLVSMRGRPTQNAICIICEHGTIRLDLFHGFAVVEIGAVSRAGKIVHPFALATATLTKAGLNLASRAARRESAYPGLRALIARFYLAVLGRGSVPITARETLTVAVLRDEFVRLALASAVHSEAPNG